MDHFKYVDGSLFCEGVSLESLAEAVNTPAYVYSSATLIDHVSRIREAFAELDPLICYSIKSCPNLSICRLLARHGVGFDVVSGGEIFRALRAGGDPAGFVFAGVGKTDVEIREAIEAGVGLLNVESECELENLIRISSRVGARIRAALRINPDVDPRTHIYTTTGLKETKFGVDLERARRAFETYGQNDAVNLCGLHLHLGSPVNAVDPYVTAIRRSLELIESLCADGYKVDTLDIGGGFGAHYVADEAPTAADYAREIVPLLRGRQLHVILEPGRSIAANAGVLLTRVLYLKRSGERRFVIVDAGMSELLRPALYDAKHFIWPVTPGHGFVPAKRSLDVRLPGTSEADIVGPICESGDFLGKSRHLPPLERGDLIAVFSAGAYGFSMSNQYNSRPRPPEILVERDSFRTIRTRETYQDLIRGEGP